MCDLVSSPLPSPWFTSYWSASASKPKAGADPPVDSPLAEPPPRSPRSIASLEDPDALFVGVLEVHRMGPEKGRPALMATSWCPTCRHSHSWSWPDDLPLDAIVQIDLCCRDKSVADRPAFLALDDSRVEQNRRTASAFRGQLRRWLVKGRMYARFARQRAGDPRNAATTGPA
ncbi:MAG: hypothetical protein ACYC1I_11755 [Acidimicrobiales bacterium]